ncbi:glycosyltransferase family 4 protein [Corynebacterium guaraldiae]|uniref:Glycosyltransferase family 4 protein n=1 Tax=Corynebacterium guaraldiae TaxID=3051103 RepID=A0ABY3CQV4_9CORY|nr:glycosyltransferase family 4 protein [Corynebacterium guaraldiae]
MLGSGVGEAGARADVTRLRLRGGTVLRILVLSQHWYPEDGVPQRRWTWLCEILQEQGHDVLVIAPPPNYLRKISKRDWVAHRGFAPALTPETGAAGETVLRSGYFPTGSSISAKILSQAYAAVSMLWILTRRPRSLRVFDPELVIGTVPALPVAAVTQYAGKRLGIPYAIDLRDAWPDLLKDSDQWNSAVGKKSLRERVMRFGPLQALKTVASVCVNTSLRDASKIFVTSEFLGEELERRYLDKAVGRDIFTVRNVFPVRTALSPRKSELDGTRSLRVLYAGTLGRAQDLDNALQAAHIAQQSGTHVTLRFVGIGVARQALEARARELGVDATFESRKPSDSLDDYYAWADTALVHLADWEPLTRTVPSKTYELMASQIFITGVVEGETEGLIEELGAGAVVPPRAPERLAQLWMDMAQGCVPLRVAPAAAAWIDQERTVVVPQTLRSALPVRPIGKK